MPSRANDSYWDYFFESTCLTFYLLQDGFLHNDYSPQEIPLLAELPEYEPVSTENFKTLLQEMRELAVNIKSLKTQNSSILTSLEAADKTMKATSRSLNVLDTYSTSSNADIKNTDTLK